MIISFFSREIWDSDNWKFCFQIKFIYFNTKIRQFHEGRMQPVTCNFFLLYFDRRSFDQNNDNIIIILMRFIWLKQKWNSSFAVVRTNTAGARMTCVKIMIIGRKRSSHALSCCYFIRGFSYIISLARVTGVTAVTQNTCFYRDV